MVIVIVMVVLVLVVGTDDKGIGGYVIPFFMGEEEWGSDIHSFNLRPHLHMDSLREPVSKPASEEK